MNCMRNKDFQEGIRAVLVDRDNAPAWAPKTLGEVTSEQVNAYFEPLGEHDLDVFATTKSDPVPTATAAATATAAGGEAK
jgi:hypothetical protein